MGYYGNNPQVKSKDTAILIHKSIPFHHRAMLNGRYIFLKGEILGHKYRYSRLDYFFIPYYHLHTVHKAPYGLMTWSDHAPLSVSLTSSLSRPKTINWRLNETLLDNPLVSQEAHTALMDYFSENTTSEVSTPAIWEAHKCTIKGIFIEWGTRIKREREEEIRKLTNIQRLELLHKSQQILTTFQDLATLRRELSTLLHQRHLCTLQHTKAHFYLHSNKCGRLLAQMINKQKSKSYITLLRTIEDGYNGCPTVSPRWPIYTTKICTQRGQIGITLNQTEGRKPSKPLWKLISTQN
ncbi:Hypothetical predicted protein [Pelobates cultripes]|uniref:Endonuclease/exonuclease/phosphatase domain-containing protein n=1 Tax=Pelobates cultripes TaxID=61616 RepID=A0AAD1ST84_PELCU|nr:Hypothetical predicted protein [Pelobates cultripes]